MGKRKHKSNIREVAILATSLFYLTSFLEKAGVIKDGKFTDVTTYKDRDITGAISLGKQLMGVLKRIHINYQQSALLEAQKVFNTIKDDPRGFNYLTFVLILLMSYKEHFRNKRFNISITYDELNDIFDAYFEVALKDREQMKIINDSTELAEEFFEKVMKIEEDKNRK